MILSTTVSIKHSRVMPSFQKRTVRLFLDLSTHLAYLTFQFLVFLLCLFWLYLNWTNTVRLFENCKGINWTRSIILLIVLDDQAVSRLTGILYWQTQRLFTGVKIVTFAFRNTLWNFAPLIQTFSAYCMKRIVTNYLNILLESAFERDAATHAMDIKVLVLILRVCRHIFNLLVMIKSISEASKIHFSKMTS